jgi:broad specificity phosphatase PhoE
MTLLYLVRHGETDWNLARRIQGRADIPLNATGRGQARRAAGLLARRDWDVIVASPLSRARETAEIIAAELDLPDPELRPALVERDYGVAEGLGFAEIDARYPEGAEVPGRESRSAVAERVVPDLLELARRYSERAVVVVTHGGAIRAVLSSVDPEWSHDRITNGSIHSFRVEDGELRLIAFDDPMEEASIEPGSADLDEQNAVEARNS